MGKMFYSSAFCFTKVLPEGSGSSSTQHFPPLENKRPSFYLLKITVDFFEARRAGKSALERIHETPLPPSGQRNVAQFVTNENPSISLLHYEEP